MSTREKFEAWMKERFADSDTTGFAPVMFVAWQASRTAALEEAAQAVEQHNVTGREWIAGSLWDVLSREAAGRIRALDKGES